MQDTISSKSRLDASWVNATRRMKNASVWGSPKARVGTFFVSYVAFCNRVRIFKRCESRVTFCTVKCFFTWIDVRLWACWWTRWRQNPFSGCTPDVLGSLTLSKDMRTRTRHVGAKDCGPWCGVKDLLWSSEPSPPPTCRAQEHQALLRNMM